MHFGPKPQDSDNEQAVETFARGGGHWIKLRDGREIGPYFGADEAHGAAVLLGLVSKIEITKDGTIVNGHGRAAAREELGIAPPVEVVDDWNLAIDRALTAEERRRFLDAFTTHNPHWRGAHVADVLETLASHDAHLDITEPLYALHVDEIKAWPAGLFVSLALATIYVYGPEAVTWERVLELRTRVVGRAS